MSDRLTKAARDLLYVSAVLDTERFAGTDQNPSGIRDLLFSAAKDVEAASKASTAKTFVLMGNDYPAAVFSDEEQAEKIAARLTELDREEAKREHRPRIYWRVYDFDTDVAPVMAREVGGCPTP